MSRKFCLTCRRCFFTLIHITGELVLPVHHESPIIITEYLMSSGLLAVLAFAPILMAGVLLIGLRWSARSAMPLVYGVTALIALFAWDMSFNRVLSSTLQGLVITLSLLWIIFGAILLLNTLKYSG